jgi:anti-anti-sigma factor
MARLGGEGAAEIAVDVGAADDGAPVIGLQGELDLSNVDAVRGALEDLLAAEPARVVFDLSGLSFMDSSGIALLIQTAERAGRIELQKPSPVVRRLIESMGLATVLGVQP